MSGPRIIVTASELQAESRTLSSGFQDEFYRVSEIVRPGEFSISPVDMATLRGKYSKGLGTAAAAVFKPIARVVDWAVGTDLQNCHGCDGRRIAWNQIGKQKG